MSDDRIRPDSADPALTRRDFLGRAATTGVALSIGVPRVGGWLRQGAPMATAASAAANTATPAGEALAPADLANFVTGLRWRPLGPFRGGRNASATGVPGRPNEFYFGAVNGGVWKSIDGGRVWKPVFDAMPVASIGAIAVAPSAPDTVYVGSGESSLRDSNGFGNGMYKSTDAGATWTHIGLDDTQHIGKIAVDPKNPDVVFVAAIGHLYAANPMRGVFRSRDGGKTWAKVLAPNDDTGAVEVVIDPTNPQVVYAGLWNTRRPPWFTYAPTNGPGGGIYKSTDGGSTWKRLTSGLPPEGIGRTGIAVAASNPRRVYAVVDCLVPDPNAPEQAPPPGSPPGTPGVKPGQGGVFRSDDAGETWTKLSGDQALWGRGWYFSKVTVDPTDPDVLYVPNVAVNRSMDGGKSWAPMRGSPGGDDYHQAWVSPDDPNTMVVASDQGTIVTRNAKAADPRSITWSSWLNQPTAQLYHISVDYRTPYWVTGAQQDSGAVAVRSRGKFGEISTRDWEPSGAGGESGYTAGDPLNPGIIYGGTGERYDLETNRPVPGTTSPASPDPKNQPLRADWTQPLVLSQADPRALYYGAQFVFRSTDGARTWTQISDDLTRPEGAAPKTLDAAAAAQVDRNGKRGVVYTIAPSPLVVPMIWAGTDDGLIHVTMNGGKSWSNVTPPQVSAWSRVTMIEASHHDMDTAFASVDRHQLQDFDPYIYRTRDRGKTWQRITAGLPNGVYVHSVKEDPERQGLLVAGTERGAFVSVDDGDHWVPLQLNLPVTSVRDFQFYAGDLIVGTHGRGIWVVDDIAPLRQVTSALVGNAWLFEPTPYVNLVQGGDDGTPLQKDEPQAPNPPAGASLYYWLPDNTSGPVTLEVMDASGAVLHTFTAGSAAESAADQRRRPAAAAASGPEPIPNTSALWREPPEPFATTPGLHRAVWYPAARSNGRGFGRAATMLAGTFTVRLTANGQSDTRTLTVLPDPR